MTHNALEHSNYLIARAIEDLQTVIMEEVSSLGNFAATRLQEQDYKAATDIAARCQKLQILGAKVAGFRDEVSAVLSVSAIGPVGEAKQGAARGAEADLKASSKRSGRSTLSVTFSNGATIAEKRAKDTFVQTLRTLGFERVARLGLICCELPLVHRGISEQHREKAEYSMEEVDGYVVVTHSSTVAKQKILNDISRLLGEYLAVRVTEA